MRFNKRYQTFVHTYWRLYALNSAQYYFKRKLNLSFTRWSVFSLKPSLFTLPCKWLLSVNLAYVPLFLLPYSLNLQAISASTVNTIQGNAPYLTFDDGVTRFTSSDDLLSIKLSDGTMITPETNTSTAANPIKLPNHGENFADIQMLLPRPTSALTNSIDLNTLVNSYPNYWGDIDGDGQGENGITATGSLSISITDNNNRKLRHNTVLSVCGDTKSPYKMVLSNTEGVLSTQYGKPGSTTFASNSETYYIDADPSSGACYANPVLPEWGIEGLDGPIDVWNPDKGFVTKSTIYSSYSSNFPTTGGNGLWFDLYVQGSGPLRWPSVTHEGITATMTPDSSGNLVRVTLTGPVPTREQKYAARPGLVSKPKLPLTFEITGYDSNNRAVVQYGFVLKQWFINRGNGNYDDSEYYEEGQNELALPNAKAWCSSAGYRLPKMKDLTNAVCKNIWNEDNGHWEDEQGYYSRCYDKSTSIVTSATPSSSENMFQRQVGAGFITEWGDISLYELFGLPGDSLITTDEESVDNLFYVVSSYSGSIYMESELSTPRALVCVYP